MMTSVLGATSTTNVALSDHEFYLLLSGALVPLVGYFFNRFALPAFKWLVNQIAWIFTSTALSNDDQNTFAETLKGIVQVAAAAGWGAIYTNVTSGNQSYFKGMGTAVVSALFAHNILWKPTNVNVVVRKTAKRVGAPG